MEMRDLSLGRNSGQRSVCLASILRLISRGAFHGLHLPYTILFLGSSFFRIFSWGYAGGIKCLGLGGHLMRELRVTNQRVDLGACMQQVFIFRFSS